MAYIKCVSSEGTVTPTTGSVTILASNGGSVGVHSFSETITVSEDIEYAYIESISGSETYQDIQGISSISCSVSDNVITITGSIYSYITTSHTRRYVVTYAYF